MITWDEAQYGKFFDERIRPARELLARVLLPTAQHIVDLGCGPGNSTALLRARFPDAQLIGVDNSPELLRKAREDQPAGTFVEADLRNYQPDLPLDLSFANAVMHWVPGHSQLFPRLFGQLRRGGVLALQMPVNFDEPSHRAMRELPGPWLDAISGVQDLVRLPSADFYYDLLAPHATSVDIWQTTYQHVMTDAAAIVEWVKGSGLRPYLDAVAASERANYLAEYTRAIDVAYPVRSDGKRQFAFPRLFLVAVRA